MRRTAVETLEPVTKPTARRKVKAAALPVAE